MLLARGRRAAGLRVAMWLCHVSRTTCIAIYVASTSPPFVPVLEPTSTRLRAVDDRELAGGRALRRRRSRRRNAVSLAANGRRLGRLPHLGHCGTFLASSAASGGRRRLAIRGGRVHFGVGRGQSPTRRSIAKTLSPSDFNPPKHSMLARRGDFSRPFCTDCGSQRHY